VTKEEKDKEDEKKSTGVEKFKLEVDSVSKIETEEQTEKFIKYLESLKSTNSQELETFLQK